MAAQQPQGPWRVKVASGEFGPVDLETIQDWIRQGRVTPNDFVLSPVTNAWVPAMNVPELAGLFPPGAAVQPFPTAPAKRKGISVGCIIAAAVAGFFLTVGLREAVLLHAKQAGPRAVCRNNLRQIGIALGFYRLHFDDSYPWRTGDQDPNNAWCDLGLLYPTYVDGTDLFICPGSDDHEFYPDPAPPGEHGHQFAPFEAGQIISYAYSYDSRGALPRPWTDSAKASVRILADKKAGLDILNDGNHGNNGRNGLDHGGGVAWQGGWRALDPDEDDDEVGMPNADSYTDWWSDPPFYDQ